MAQIIDVPGMGEVEFPDGMSDAQISDAIRKSLSSGQIPIDPSLKAPASTGQASFLDMLKDEVSNSLFGKAAKTAANVPQSALNFAKGIAQTVMHPLDTAQGVADLAAGAGRAITPEPVRSAIDRMDWSPDARQRASQVATNVGRVYADRYGGPANIANTVQADPVGFAADLSTVLGLGGGALKAAGVQSGAKLTEASSLLNPISAVAKVGDKAIRGVGNAAAFGIGELGTHTGGPSLRTAARAGYTGGQAADDLAANMRGSVPMEAVLGDAKNALQAMRDSRGAQYVADKIGWSASTKPISFKPIDDAFDAVRGSLKEGGHWKVGKGELPAVKEVEKVIREWRNDPSMHTPLGLDALKQRIASIYPENPAHAQAQRVITATERAVKDQILREAPDYAKAMEAYEKSISAQREIERALSLTGRASADTALRKLQSVTRNNANTNFGNRVSMIEELGGQGGKDLMPALAGQSLTSIAPRGLGKLAASATVGSAMFEPWMAALLPFQSPRVMGETALALGKGYRLLGEIDPALPMYAGQAGLLDR